LNQTLNKLIESAYSIKYMPPYMQEWISPLAVDFWREMRGFDKFNLKAYEWVRKHAPTIAALENPEDCAHVQIQLWKFIGTWQNNGIILVNGKTNKVYFDDDHKDNALAPIRPLKTKPRELEIRNTSTEYLISGRPMTWASQEQVDAINRIQEVPYKINVQVLHAMKKHIVLSDDQHIENYCLEYAEQEHEHKYYLPCFLDWRGRIYTDSGSLLSYQNGDMHRALCDYAEKYPVDISSPYFKVFLQHLQDEYDINVDNYAHILHDPYHNIEKKIYKSKDKVWCRYRAALALYECLQYGETSYIMQQDATCSGMGHMACIMKDARLAYHTALRSKINKDEDLYSVTASHAVENNRFFTYKEYGKEYDVSRLLENKEVYDELSSRKSAKKPVMIIAYGSSVIGIARGWLNDADVKYTIEEDQKEIDILDKLTWGQVINKNEIPFPKTVAAARENGIKPGHLLLCLANAYSRSLQSLFPSITEFINFMKQVSQKTFNIHNRSVQWRSPIGMFCFNQKAVTLEKDINFTVPYSKSRGISEVLQNVASTAGQSPNRIHSIDAAVMLHSCNLASNCNVIVSPIHDSWGTRISDCILIRELVRQAMIDVHMELSFNELDGLPIKEIPKGSWDINDMSISLIS